MQISIEDFNWSFGLLVVQKSLSLIVSDGYTYYTYKTLPATL
jgi:hypothetical protein